MSTKIENVVYRASWRDEISANFESVSFSTATLYYTRWPVVRVVSSNQPVAQ